MEEADYDHSLVNANAQAMAQVLNSDTVEFTKKKTIEMQEEEFAPSGQSDIIGRRQRDKEMMREAFGEQKYQELYGFLLDCRR